MPHSRLPDMSKDKLTEIIDEIIAERDRLHSAPGEVVSSSQDCWCLVDGEVTSVRNMNDEELQLAVIEELLNVVYWRSLGKQVGGDIHYFTRFLVGEQEQRVINAFNSTLVKSMIVTSPAGHIELSPEHMQDAMDLSGTYLSGWESLTDEPVYQAPKGM